MTAEQKAMRAIIEKKLGRPNPKTVELDMGLVIRDLLDRVPKDRRLDLHSDGHPAYTRAIKTIQKERGDVIDLSTISSRAARTPDNPLFVINATDALLRHSQANHRRETIAASKRRQMGIERLAVFVVWRNFVKRRFENGPVESPAMVGGWTGRMWTWGDVFQRRLFRREVVLPRRWDEYYERRVRTLIYGDRQVLHTCKYPC